MEDILTGTSRKQIKMKVEFGGKITVTHRLKRGRHWLPEEKTFYKKWHVTKIKPCEVIVIGKRLLSDGSAEWTGEATIYNPDRFFTAYLVVKSMNENPFYILPDQAV